MNSVKSYLILYNIMKRSNMGFLFRTANAFGVAEVLVVGKRSFNMGGACGMGRRTAKRHFFTLDAACEYVRSRDASICGIEIGPDSQPVTRHPFVGSTAFMLGNEESGLTDSQIAVCDTLVHVPQYGDASCLNVNVAAGIVLHHFATWAKLDENPRSGSKFVSRAEDAP